MDELKSRFDDAVGGITAPPTDVRRITARGKKRQRWYLAGSAAALAAMVAIGVLGVSALLGADDNDVAGDRKQMSSARFQTDYPQTRRNPQEVIGVLEVDAAEGTICSTAYFPWAKAAQVHERVPLSRVDPVYITLFEPPTGYESPICLTAARSKLARIIEKPHLFYVDYHEKDTGGNHAQSEPLAPWPDEQPEPAPSSPPEDRTATEVVEHLRRYVHLCRGFDFYYRDEIEGSAYRPVQCGAETEMVEDGRPVEAPGTPGPIEGDDFETRYLSGPDLVVYAFQDREARDAWLATEHPGLGGRVYGEEWVIDVMDRDLYRRVVASAPQGAEEAIAPEDEVVYGDHSLETAEPIRRVGVSLPEAIETARAQEELLIAEPVVYRGPDAETRRAWHVVLRRCIPSYGGTHADPSCEGEQTHVVIDVRSGTVLAEFVT